MKRLTLVLAIVLAVSLLCGCVANKLDFWVEGICLVSDNGFVLLIVKDEPIVLHDRTDGGLFGGIIKIRLFGLGAKLFKSVFDGMQFIEHSILPES